MCVRCVGDDAGVVITCVSYDLGIRKLNRIYFTKIWIDFGISKWMQIFEKSKNLIKKRSI